MKSHASTLSHKEYNILTEQQPPQESKWNNRDYLQQDSDDRFSKARVCVSRTVCIVRMSLYNRAVLCSHAVVWRLLHDVCV